MVQYMWEEYANIKRSDKENVVPQCIVLSGVPKPASPVFRLFCPGSVDSFVKVSPT